MNKIILKADKLFIESYITQKYPPCTHDLNLDMTFDYYGGLCTQFLNNKKVLSHKVIDMVAEEKEKIEEYIKNNNNENGHDTLIFYLMTKTAVLILQRHYNDDGTRKY